MLNLDHSQQDAQVKFMCPSGPSHIYMF